MDGRLLVLMRFIEALGEPIDIHNVISRKRFQKAVYLGQLTGVDLGYRYSWYIRGPYSTDLTKDYYALASALESGDGPPEEKQLRPELAEKLRAIATLLRVPADVLLNEPEWYELLASWHYLLRVSRVSEDRARETMREQKPRLFPYLNAADGGLRAHGLLGV
jgi:uncharacterized protein YwgA